MANNGFKVKNKLNIAPGTETTDAQGDIRIESSDGTLRVHDGSSEKTILTSAAGVTGAASSTDNAVARFDGTGGKTLQNSGVTIDDSDNVVIPGNLRSDGTTLDLADATTASIATTNTASTINIGNGSGANTINIGGASSTVNITGSVNNQNVTNMNVSDKLVTVNDGGAAASGGAAGLEVEEDSSITGYAKTSADRNSWEFKAPNTNGIASLTPGASADVVTLNAASQTLTNKTIDAANNTVTNVSLTTGVTGTLPDDNGGTGQSTYTTGDMLYASATNTLSKLGIGSSTQVLTVAGGVPTWATPSSAPDQSYEISNLSIACSVGGSALTIAIKDKAGSDPSAGSPVKVGFRNATLATGTYNQRLITSSLSMTISSGSTLGHSSATEHTIWVYLIDNAGTLELAVSHALQDVSGVVSTTAEGGAGAADSNSTIYSTTARSNVAARVIGKLLSTQTTAGTWAAVPTMISLLPGQLLPSETVAAQYYISGSTANSSFADDTLETVDYDTKSFDTHNAVATGASWKFTAPASGIYKVYAKIRWANSTNLSDTDLIMRKNGIQYLTSFDRLDAVITGRYELGGSMMIRLLAGDYIDIQASQNDSASATRSINTTSRNYIEIIRLGNY